MITEDFLYTEIRASLQHEHERHSGAPSYSDLKAFLQIVHGIFEQAGRRGVISNDPSHWIKADDFKRSCSLPKHDAADKIISPAQVEILESDMISPANRANPHAQGVRMVILTGMRVGELAALTWDDIDDNGIHIHKQKIFNEDQHGKRNGFRIVDYTKDERGVSKGGRYYPITPDLKDLIEEIRQYQISTNRYSPDGYVFLSGSSTDSISPESYEQYLNRHSKKLGFQIHNHTLRMSLNSNWLIGRLDVADRALILGHSVEVNLRNYSYAGSHRYSSIRDKLSS